MPRRTKEESEETRQKLLLAALDVFCEKGYSRTTLADIASRIGMTRGAVYWHFENKENLIASLVKEMQTREEALVRQNIPDISSLDNLLGHFVERARVVLQDETVRKFVYFISLQIEMSVGVSKAIEVEMGLSHHGPFPDVREALEQSQRDGKVRKDVDLDEVMDVLLGLWVGLIKMQMIGFSKNTLPRCVEVGFGMVIDSIRAKKASGENQKKGRRHD